MVPHNFEHIGFAEDKRDVKNMRKSPLDLTGIETRSTAQK